jgi:chromosome segregation ATPase
MHSSPTSTVAAFLIPAIRFHAPYASDSKSRRLWRRELWSSLEQFKDIADSYAADNDKLRRDLAARGSELEQLRGEVQRLESEKQVLRFHLRQAKASQDEVAELEPDAPEQDEGEQPPSSGEVRFYKKVHSTRTHDVLKRVNDCGHTSWQSAEKADKAKKGIARLVGERTEWKSFQHCGSCTGGGMWRVRW